MDKGDLEAVATPAKVLTSAHTWYAATEAATAAVTTATAALAVGNPGAAAL